MLYDITAKDLCKYYPVYTKAGFIWKNRINWEVIQVAGNKVKTYFGIFTFLRAYKVDKVWYWVLTDGTKTITVKRDQARRNKKLPKTATVQTTLMLAQPKELIDTLVEEMQIRAKQYNKSFKEKYGKRKKKGLLPLIPQCDTFDCKVMYLSLSQKISQNLYNSYYKQLVQHYHPDKGNVHNTDCINDILFLYK